MTSERIDELLALAALGELTDADERELVAVAERDREVADEWAQILASAAAIQATGAEEPPVGLRADVLAAIRQTPQESAVAHEAASVAQSAVSPPVQLDERRRRRWSPIAAAVAAAAVLVIGGVVLVANEASAPDGVAAVVDAADAQQRTLNGELAGTLTVVYSESEDAIVVEGDGLPTLDSSQTYQLWLVDDGGAVSAGVFRPDEAGTVEERFDGVDPTGFVLGVTAEPAGGSESPTLPILASA
jgi:Anti-sigma-K factor rskA, C-terminal